MELTLYRCFGLNMLTTLPLEAFVCREVMTNYWFPDERWNPNRHLIFTTSLVITATTLSLMTCDLGAVFELIGATSACALAYILPPLCYIKLSSRSWKTIPAMICVGFGVAVMGVSLIQAVAKIIRSKNILHELWNSADLRSLQMRAELRLVTRVASSERKTSHITEMIVVASFQSTWLVETRSPCLYHTPLL